MTPHYYSFKKQYPINNRQSFQKYLLERGELGIPDNYELWLCYDGIKDDIVAMIDEGWIRVVDCTDAKTKKKAEEEKNKKKKEIEPIERMLFPKDIANADVEYTNEQLPSNCHAFLAKLWDKNVGDITNIKWEQILQEEQGLLSEQEKEILVTRKIKNQANKES